MNSPYAVIPFLYIDLTGSSVQLSESCWHKSITAREESDEYTA